MARGGGGLPRAELSMYDDALHGKLLRAGTRYAEKYVIVNRCCTISFRPATSCRA